MAQEEEAAIYTTRALAVYFDTSDPTSFTPGGTEITSIDTYSLLTNKTGSFGGTLTSGSISGNNFLSFNGTNSYIDLTGESTMTANATSGSIEMWVSSSYIANVGAFDEPLIFHTQDSRDKGIFYGGNGTSEEVGGIQYYNGTSPTYSPSTTSVTGGWHQIVYTYDLVNGPHNLYIDGALANSFVRSGDTPGGVADTTSIGRGNGPLAGKYAEMDFMICRIYDDELTADEVLNNFNVDKSKVGL